MSENKLDAVLQKMSELTETVKGRGEDATLDFDSLKAELTDLVDEKVKTEVEKQKEEAPQRRVSGDAIGHYDVDREALGKANRYGRMVKDFERDGFHKGFATQKIAPVDLYLTDLLLKQANTLYPDRVAAPSQDLKAAIKALTSTGSGTGDELVPTEMAGQLWEDIFLASRVVSSLQTIPMPSNPFEVPLGLGDVTWRKGTENTATTASDPATAKSTLTATEQVAEVNWSYTLEEDAVITLMPALRSRLGISGGEQVDAFALNADATDAATGNINLDDADPDADSYYLTSGQDGIRHVYIVDNTGMGTDAGGDALADGDITGELSAMGKYAADPNQLVMVCDISTYLKGFLGLTNVVTVDKFGPDAAVLTGQLAAYRGIPIVTSASMSLTEADGKVSTTAGNNTLGQIAVVNRNMWYVGFRRELLIEIDRDIQKRQFIMVLSFREALAAHGTRASITHTGGIFNILV